MSTDDRLYEFLVQLTDPINAVRWQKLRTSINKILDGMHAPYRYVADQHGTACLFVKKPATEEAWQADEA